MRCIVNTGIGFSVMWIKPIELVETYLKGPKYLYLFSLSAVVLGFNKSSLHQNLIFHCKIS